jgi:hypothetical protein
MKLRNDKLIEYPFETATLSRKNTEKQNEVEIFCRNRLGTDNLDVEISGCSPRDGIVS